MYVQRRNITTEATRPSGRSVHRDTVICDRWGERRKRMGRNIEWKEKRDVQCRQSVPILPLRSVCAAGFPYCEQPAARTRALPVVSVACARSRRVPLRATCHSVPRPSVASLFGIDVEIHDSAVRWAKTRARPNASAVAWLQRDEAECKCERGRFECPEVHSRWRHVGYAGQCA
jgi:hypothetical protein